MSADQVSLEMVFSVVSNMYSMAPERYTTYEERPVPIGYTLSGLSQDVKMVMCDW